MLSEENQTKLIDYLYGEMSESERQDFEKEIKQNPDLQKELAELQGTQQILGVTLDVEVPQFSFLEKPPKQMNPIIRNLGLSISKIAATLTLLFLLAYWFQLGISVENQSLSIHFGEKKKSAIVEKSISAEDSLRIYLVSYLKKQNQQWDEKWTDLEKKLDKVQLESSKNKLTQANTPKFSLEEIKLLIHESRETDLKKINELIAEANIHQEGRIKDLLKEYNQYLAEQRRKDLKAIAMDLSNLQEIQYIQKVETENILATLIQTINPENYENK
jgi:hypothetical protein